MQITIYIDRVNDFIIPQRYVFSDIAINKER